MKQKSCTPVSISPLRRHWGLKAGTIFLNHGSFGACPTAILKLQADLRRLMEAEPVQFLWRHYEERLEPARRALAGFVGARAGDLVFVSNATSGVNAVLQSIPWRTGDELLTTDHDYNACRTALVETARAAGARVVVVQVPLPIRDQGEMVASVFGPSHFGSCGICLCYQLEKLPPSEIRSKLKEGYEEARDYY